MISDYLKQHSFTPKIIYKGVMPRHKKKLFKNLPEPIYDVINKEW